MFGLLFVFSLLRFKISDAAYCMAKDNSSKDLHHGLTSIYASIGSRVKPKLLQGCDIKAMWLLIRTGSHYPTKQEMQYQMWENAKTFRKEIITNHIKTRGTLCKEDLAALEAWFPVFTITNANTLSKTGYDEIASIGKDLARWYSTVFKNKEMPATIMYAYGNKSTTIDSAEAFMDGMKEEGMTSKLVNLGQYTVLSLEKSCPLWGKFERKDELFYEYKMYKNKETVKRVLHSVSQRLGFTYDLTFHTVYEIFKLCSYETAITEGMYSPWCAVFEKDQLQVFRNADDIYYYYTSGFGNSQTQHLGCPTVRNLFLAFSEVTKSESLEPQVTILFGHSLNIRAVLTVLGIASDDEKLTSVNADEMVQRMWNMSTISPFASNLLALLYKCGGNYKVKFMLNNYEVHWADCDESPLCKWSDLMVEFGGIINPQTCNFDFCIMKKLSDSNTLGMNVILHAMATLIGINSCFHWFWSRFWLKCIFIFFVFTTHEQMTV